LNIQDIWTHSPDLSKEVEKMSSSKNMIIGLIVIIIIAGGAVGVWYLLGTGGTTTTTTTTTTTGNPNPYDVAIVFATGGLGDKSFNDGCYAGAQEAEDELGIDFTYVEPTEIAEYEGYLRDYVAHEPYDDPYDLIISIGFDQAEALGKVANDTPNQQFAIVDMFMDPAVYPNITSLVFNEHEGSALVGAIAGLMTEQDDIAFVGGMDIPLINKFLGGYVWGANYTNEGITYRYDYTNDWVDTTAGQTLADGFYAAGSDIIFAAAGRSGLGVFTSCENNNGTEDYPMWVIGVDSPQMYLGCEDPENPEAPTFVLTSMLKKVDVAVYNVIEEVVEGTFDGGVWAGSVANGGLDYEVNEDLLVLPTSVIDAVEDLKEAIIADPSIVPDHKYWED
jgi:basic membrane protein A